jgi:hypothetical protein
VICSRRRNWWRAAGALAAVASLVPTQAAHAATGCSGPAPCVVVVVVGDGPDVTREFPLSFVQDNASGSNTFVLHFPGKGTPQSLGSGIPALSVYDLLGDVQLPSGVLAPERVNYALVRLSENQAEPSVVTRADLSGDFPGGLLPSLFSQGGALAYFRPWRGGTDVNSTEYGQTPNGVIEVTAHVTGEPLGVSLGASKTTVNVGDTTSVTAKMLGNTDTTSAPQGKVSYTWDFTDGSAQTADAGRTVTQAHRWKTQGTFPVTVTAEDSTGNFARSQTVTVTVGPKPKPGGGTHHGHGHHHQHRHHHPPSGPTHGHGHQNHGHRHGTRQSQGGNSGTTSSAHSGRHERQGRQGRSQQNSTGPTRRQGLPPSAGGDRVKGLLLQGAQVFSAPPSSRTVPRISAAAESPADAWSLPWRIFGGIGVPIALIGLGMAGEALQLRRRVTRMSA